MLRLPISQILCLDSGTCNTFLALPGLPWVRFWPLPGSPAENVGNENRLTTVARHDLVFSSVGFFALKWDHEYVGLATAFTPDSIQKAVRMRKALLATNPQLILIAEIRYRDAARTFLPPDHKWWKRDEKGKLQMGWKEGGYIQLDFANPEYREHVVTRASAAMRSGVLDGVMLDWWREDTHRLKLVEAIRKAIGDSALILVNPNDNKIPKSAPFVNGLFMECYRSKTPQDWARIADTLQWAEKNLRTPRINCVETWYHHSRNDLSLMRATTTLTLTLSDGYCLFSDPNPLPTPDHLHDWYSFWDKRLGRAVSSGRKRRDGAVSREFENGTVVYNPLGNQVITISFGEDRTSLAFGKRSKVHVVKPGDGDAFLEE